MIELFKNYLQQRRYMESTVNGHLQNVGYFLKWIEANGLYEVENVSYTDLLNYVQYEQQRNKDVSTINLRISSIWVMVLLVLLINCTDTLKYLNKKVKRYHIRGL